MAKPMVLMALLLAGGCQSLPAASGPVTGRWSGPHISMALGAGGGTIDYDCAHGTIESLVTATGGAFVAHGTHTPEHGGPVRADEALPVLMTRYSGRLRGDHMTLMGRVDNGILLGPFELRRGAEAMLTRCL